MKNAKVGTILWFQSYSNGNYVPSWAKFEYGAWYLSPKTWKKRDAGGPLLDPKQIKVSSHLKLTQTINRPTNRKKCI